VRRRVAKADPDTSSPVPVDPAVKAEPPDDDQSPPPHPVSPNADYHSTSVAPDPRHVKWHPRPPPGLHQLSEGDLAAARGAPRSPDRPAPSVLIRPTATSSAMDAAVRELTDYDIVEPAPPDAPVTGSVYLRPVTATKTVPIFDLRPHSLAQDHDPVRFSLPLPAHLQPHILASPHAHLTRIDVSRYYDSLRLPPTAASFVFAYDGRKFRYRRLPFGWDRAPAVAQRLMLSLVRTAVDSVRTTHRVTALVYLDDVVVLCDDPRECDEVTRAITEHMTAAGLLPNREKSVLVPTPSLTALGRTISVPDATIRPTEGTVAAAVKAALRVATAPTSRKTKLAAAGLLLWASRRVFRSLSVVALSYSFMCDGGRQEHRPGVLHPRTL